MNDFGLDKREGALLLTVFQRHPEITKVVLFGSRAKGTSKLNSDIDLAVKGSCSAIQIEALALELDELPLPYKFDVTSLSSINNAALQEHIERVGTIIYQRMEGQGLDIFLENSR